MKSSITKKFDTRSTLLHPYLNTFHQCKSLQDIKICLERMDSGDHALLVALHEAYANHFVDVSTSFGQAKATFRTFAHMGHFNYDTFDTYPLNTPLSNFHCSSNFPMDKISHMAWHPITKFAVANDNTTTFRLPADSLDSPSAL